MTCLLKLAPETCSVPSTGGYASAGAFLAKLAKRTNTIEEHSLAITLLRRTH